MRNFKRRISFLLVMVMVFAMLAVPAHAVEIKDGKAIVSDLEIDLALMVPGTDTATVLCNEVAMVSAVEISAASVNKLAVTGKSLTVVAAMASIEVNNAALKSIASQTSKNGLVTLNIDMDASYKLNAAQAAYVAEKNPMLVLAVDVQCDGSSVAIGESGCIYVNLPEMLVGTMGEQYVVAMLGESGKAKVVETKMEGGYLTAQLSELAVYVLMDKSAVEEEEEEIVNPFDDVADSDWFLTPVMWAVENGVTSGYSDNTFRPYNTCTRAEVVTFLYAAAGKPEVTAAESTFADVSADDWFFKPVMWAVENGITSGYSDNTFRPYNTCTRAEVVTFLWASNGKNDPAAAESSFGDVAASDWFFKPVMWAAESGITSGYSDNTFRPSNTCTRAEVVTFLRADAIK